MPERRSKEGSCFLTLSLADREMSFHLKRGEEGEGGDGGCEEEEEKKILPPGSMLERDSFPEDQQTGGTGLDLLRNSCIDVSNSGYMMGENRHSSTSILKKNSTASGASRQSKLSVHFGENEEEAEKEREREEAAKKERSRSSQHTSSSLSRRSRLSEAEEKHREELRKSMENLNAELQLLSISDTGSSRSDGHNRLLNVIGDVDDPELSHTARKMLSRRRCACPASLFFFSASSRDPEQKSSFLKKSFTLPGSLFYGEMDLVGRADSS